MENNETNGGAIEILVAEDSPTQSAQLVHLLETRGYAVVAAKNGREALARFEERTPSLVITDVMMPEMDGFGLCRAIKATPEGKSVPVVLLTTLSDPEDVIRGLETGADNFIRKPYEEKYLLSRIDYLLMNQRMRRGQRLQIGVELNLGGERHFITSERQQILDLLISTYEQAVQINNDLKARERELGETNAVVNALYRLAEELNRAGSESEVLEGALERAMRLPFVESGWILLRDGDAMRVAASRNLPPALATAGAFEGACTCTRLCLSGELESVTNVMECERLQTPAGDMLGFRHHAAVPLWLGDRVLGVMNLVGHGEGAVGEEELRTLYNIGNQVAVALDRARLRGHLERVVEERTAKLEAEIAHRARAEEETALRARREAALAELGRVAVTGAALEDFFDEACWIVSETLGADIVKIAECEGGGVVVRAGKPMRGMGPLSDPAQIDFVLASDEPVVVADYTWDSRFRRSPELERERIASSVSVAIRGEDGPFGLISAFSKKVGAFPPGSELFVRAVADLIAAAVSRRRAEESLHESESLLQIASRVARVGAWTIELPDMSMTISDEIRAIYEMPADWEPSVDEAIGFCAPEHQDLVRSAFRKCAEEGTPYDIEMQLITARERRIWVRSIGEADRDASGTIRRVHGAFQDISERKEAVENTRALAERLTRTLESVADTFYTLDREYRFTYLNAAGEKLLQRPREELLGRNIWELFPDTLGTLFHEQYRRAMEEEVPVAFEFFYEPLDLWVDMRAFPSQEGLTIFARDITEQKRARQTIEESEERFRLLFDKNPYPAWVYDLETLRFLAVNEAAVRQYGWSREEFLGMTIKDIRPPDTIPDLLRSIEDRPDDRTPLLEGVFTHLKKDGTAIEVEIASSPIALFGRPARLILATDVTERRRMEQQFLRAQRMESIGTLASGIAHDLNNLLMPVMMGVTLLRREGTSPAAARALENIERSARRGKDLVRQVLSFARGVEGSRVPVNVADIVREIRSIVESTFPKSISLAVDVPNDLWFIDADPTQINQILLNLCVNARDAMPAGGRLSISAKNAEIDEQYARMDQGVPAGRYVFVEVADEGTGIPKELQDRIFEPFYTTKEVGRGTGLGLSTVAAIVRAHGGSISVYSEPGEGTSFKIYLPAQEEKRVEAPAPADLATLPQGRGETILVVDDESAILAITQQTLETYGYRVFTAEDGAQAVGIWASHRDEIAVVITDMMMPIMDGPALIVALRRMDPTVKVIASSGLDDEPRTARAAQAGVAHFLQKPYTAETLLQMIRRAIDSRNGSS